MATTKQVHIYPLGIYGNGSCQIKIDCSSVTPIIVATDTSGELALWVETETGNSNIPHMLCVEVHDFVDSSDFGWRVHLFVKNPHPD